MIRLKSVIIVFLLGLSFPALGQNTTAMTGYRDGFFFQTHDGNFSFKVGARINTLYSYGNLDQEPNISSFDLKHGKLYFGGHAFDKTIQFYGQSAFAQNSRLNDFGLANENAAFALEDLYIRGNYGDVALQLGQFKVPYSKQWMIYSGNLEFVTRSIASDAFQFGRDRGVLLSGKKPWMSYMLGMFNGASLMQVPSFNTLTNSQNLSNDGVETGMMYVARLSFFPLRPTGFSEGDAAFNEASRIEWGFTFALDQNRDYDLNQDMLADETGVNTASLSSDVTWLRKGFSFQGEFYYRHHNFETITDVDSLGMYAQIGYFLIPRKFDLAVRYAFLEPDMDVSDNHSNEFSGVAGLYLSNNHKHKMQWQYTRTHQEGLNKTDHWFHWMLQLTI